MTTRNIFQQLAEQIRSLKNENEELKRNSNGGNGKSYIKQLFQMTIKNMKLKVEHSKSAMCAIKFKEENDILKEKNLELENRIKEYEESMKQLTDLIGEPPSYEESVGNIIIEEEEPIIACNPTKIQSIIRGFLMRKKELLKCGICYETKCEHAKVKTQCCKNIICKGCFQRVSRRCPFCRNEREYRNSIPFDWWNTTDNRWRLVGINDREVVAIRDPPYHRRFNVPYNNCPNEWKFKVGSGGWYSKYCELLKRLTLRYASHDWDYNNYPLQQYPKETDDALIRLGPKIIFNWNQASGKYFRIIEGNSLGIYRIFKKLYPVPSNFTTANPRTEEAKIEIVKIVNNELKPLVGKAYGVGRARGFDYDACERTMDRRGFEVRNHITNESCKGQTRDSKWNRAFLRLLCGEYNDECHPYIANNTEHNYKITYFILKKGTQYNMFLINHTANQEARAYQRTRNNEFWFISPSTF